MSCTSRCWVHVCLWSVVGTRPQGCIPMTRLMHTRACTHTHSHTYKKPKSRHGMMGIIPAVPESTHTHTQCVSCANELWYNLPYRRRGAMRTFPRSLNTWRRSCGLGSRCVCARARVCMHVYAWYRGTHTRAEACRSDSGSSKMGPISSSGGSRCVRCVAALLTVAAVVLGAAAVPAVEQQKEELATPQGCDDAAVRAL